MNTFNSKKKKGTHTLTDSHVSRNIFLMSMVSGFTNGSEWFTIAGTLGAGTFKASLGHCKKKRVNLKKGKEKKGEKSRGSCRARSYLYKSKSRNGTSVVSMINIIEYLIE